MINGGGKMKNKFISEREWNRKFDRLHDGLGERSEDDGSISFTTESFEAYMERVINMPEYQMIGVRYQLKVLIRRLKQRRRDRR